METNGKPAEARQRIRRTSTTTELPMAENNTSQLCGFTGYDADVLMKETANLRKLITKKEHLKS